MTTAASQPTNLQPWLLKFEALDLKMRDNDTMEDTQVVRAGVPFDLYLSFTGKGVIFQWGEFLKAPYIVSYFAESMGKATEVDFPVRNGNLIPGHTTYTDADTKIAAVINEPGVYELTGMVTFPGAPGITGFVSGLLIEVYK